MRKIKLLIVTVFIAALSTHFIFTAPIMATSQNAQIVCQGVGGDTSGGNCNPAGGTATINSTAATIVNLLSLIVGAVAVIMVIYGGFKYLTSNGESNRVQEGRNTLIYAI